MAPPSRCRQLHWARWGCACGSATECRTVTSCAGAASLATATPSPGSLASAAGSRDEPPAPAPSVGTASRMEPGLCLWAKAQSPPLCRSRVHLATGRVNHRRRFRSLHAGRQPAHALVPRTLPKWHRCPPSGGCRCRQRSPHQRLLLRRWQGHPHPEPRQLRWREARRGQRLAAVVS